MKAPKFKYNPSIISSLKGYNQGLFMKDLMSGLIVGIVALPLAIAFGIASGVSPEKGLITAIIAGFIAAIFGGSKVQVSGPTGAFIVIVYGIVQNFGVEGLAIATFLAGVILVLMGLLKIGTIIKFIPYPIVVGFTSGIAVTIFTTQIKDIFGLDIASLPGGCIEQWMVYFKSFGSTNFYSLGVSILSVLIIVYTPKISKKIPGSLVAIVVMTVVAYVLRNYFGINEIETIGDRFSIQANLPAPQGLDLSFEKINLLFSAAITIALLGAIESLLSATVADGVTGDKHDSNSELIGQGIANLVVPFFGGIPATGAIARTMTNINNGGRTAISAIIHAIVLLLILLFLGSLSSLIPMSALAGVLVIVAYNMSEWRTFKALLRSDKTEVIVLLTTFFLTVIFDLTIAIEVGLLLAVVLFIRRLSEAGSISVMRDDVTASDDPDVQSEEHLALSEGIEVYEIDGPFFFGLATKFEAQMKSVGSTPLVRIIRMRKVPFIDSTGIHNLEILYKNSQADSVAIILSGVNEDVAKSLKSSGLADKIGAENICSNIHMAVERAHQKLETIKK